VAKEFCQKINGAGECAAGWYSAGYLSSPEKFMGTIDQGRRFPKRVGAGIFPQSGVHSQVWFGEAVEKGDRPLVVCWALRNFPVRKNPERNKPETRNNPEYIHKSRNPKTRD
jgi:hypothetical protein